MFNKSEKITSVVANIERDTMEFVTHEIALYLSNPDNTNLSNSAIANLALFNLPALATANGYEQMLNLFSDHFDQMTARRINQHLHTLYIRYGKILNTIRRRSIASMNDIYGIDKRILKHLSVSIPAFWLQPFIRYAYFAIVERPTKTTER